MRVNERRLLELFQERENALRSAHGQMQVIRDICNGDRSLITTEMWGPNERPAVPNIIDVGLNQTAMRVASTSPMAWFPPTRPGIAKSEEAARLKREVMRSWKDANKIRRKRRRRARHLIGYGSSPVIIQPNHRLGIPTWHVMSPLLAFPAETADPDDMRPTDCAFGFARSLGWLRQNYPEQAMRLYKGDAARSSTMFRVLWFVDAEQWVMAVLGTSRPEDEWNTWADSGQSQIEILEQTENRIGECPVVIPGRISIDRIRGAYDTLVGLYERTARLMALEEIAIRRGVLSETWLEGDNVSAASIVQPADARSGQVGVVKGGKLREIRPDPSFAAFNAVDRGERAMRAEGQVPADFTGESASNVRTGRRGDSILGATIDFSIQEYQELLAESEVEEGRLAIAIDRAYYNRPKMVQVSGGKGSKTYTPSELWDTDHHEVRYASPGSDLNGLTVRTGQKLGLEMISVETAMENDPEIDDPEREKDRIIAEGIKRALFAAFQQKLADGTMAIEDGIEVADAVLTGRMELLEAMKEARDKAKIRQSQTVEPAAPGSPEAMPGLDAGPAGAATGTIPPPDDDLGRLTSMLAGLRLPQRSSPAEQQAEQMAALG